MNKLLACLAFSFVIVTPVQAASQTVTLSVPGMTCPVCPITVKAALSRVKGVNQVSVAFDKRETTVTYDNAVTNLQALTKATAAAGYPSSLKQ